MSDDKGDMMLISYRVEPSELVERNGGHGELSAGSHDVVHDSVKGDVPHRLVQEQTPVVNIEQVVDIVDVEVGRLQVLAGRCGTLLVSKKHFRRELSG